MKKLMLFLLILVLPASALGETLYYGTNGNGAEEAIAKSLCAALGWEADASDSGSEAWNRLFEHRNGYALGTQQQLIEGLQGYTAKDPRKALQPVLTLGGNDLYLVCSDTIAQEADIHDLPDLQNYLADHPYELTLMRVFTASNADSAAYHLLEALDFDMDTFVDEADCIASLGDGPYALVVDTDLALTLTAEGHTVLGPLTEARTKEFPELPCAAECGLPVHTGTCYMLLAPIGAGISSLVPQVESELSDPTFETMLANFHLHPVQTDDFSWNSTVDDLVNYMTAEGLFFYDNDF